MTIIINIIISFIKGIWFIIKFLGIGIINIIEIFLLAIFSLIYLIGLILNKVFGKLKQLMLKLLSIVNVGKIGNHSK